MDYMSYALEEAYKAKDKGEIPIGAVIVKDNKVIGRGHNTKESTQNVLNHGKRQKFHV